MPVSLLKQHINTYFPLGATKNPVLLSPMPGLTLLQSPKTTQLEASIYDPCVCQIIQGGKETSAGGKTVRFGAGESLIVSHSVPVVSRITEASPEQPYIALIMTIDTSILRTLSHEIELNQNDQVQGRSLIADKTEERLLDAMTRYLQLSTEPLEAKVMGPLIQKEIYFRLLMASHGSMLRKLLEHGSYASQISRSISQIKKNAKKPLSVPMLARQIGMSESLFYKHFKQVTETTPLQFQKEIRLIEAQLLLRNSRQSVSTVAFYVGYASATQFSREYSRKFGRAPSEEAMTMQNHIT